MSDSLHFSPLGRYRSADDPTVYDPWVKSLRKPSAPAPRQRRPASVNSLPMPRPRARPAARTGAQAPRTSISRAAASPAPAAAVAISRQAAAKPSCRTRIVQRKPAKVSASFHPAPAPVPALEAAAPLVLAPAHGSVPRTIVRVHEAAEASHARAREQAQVDLRQCGFWRRLGATAVAVFDLIASAATAPFHVSVSSLAEGRPSCTVLQLAWHNAQQAYRHGIFPGEMPAVSRAPVATAAEPALASAQAREAFEALDHAREAQQKAAREAQVDAARSVLRWKLLGVAAGVACVGITAFATAATGGLGAPALAISTLLLRQGLANAYCAWQNHKALLAGAEPLPMGGNALANGLHAHYLARGQSEADARWSAAKTSASIAVLTSATGIATGKVLPVAVSLAEGISLAGAKLIQFGVAPARELHKALGAQQTTREAQARHREQVFAALGRCEDQPAPPQADQSRLERRILEASSGMEPCCHGGLQRRWRRMRGGWEDELAPATLHLRGAALAKRRVAALPPAPAKAPALNAGALLAHTSRTTAALAFANSTMSVVALAGA